MPTREPMFWVVPIVAGLLGGGGGSAGVNYLWAPEPAPPQIDLVMEYRVTQIEMRDGEMMRNIAALEDKFSELPPPYWQKKISSIEENVRKISDAMIRLEQHGHPELEYKDEE